MATGDLQGNIERLRSELRQIKYPGELDVSGARYGDPSALLPILNYVLVKFSKHIAQNIVASGYELQGKTDARFVECAFKIFREHFNLKPVLTPTQYLEQGFAERKLMLLHDVIQYCKGAHNTAVRQQRLASMRSPTKPRPKITAEVISAAASPSPSAKPAGKVASKGARRRLPTHAAPEHTAAPAPAAPSAPSFPTWDPIPSPQPLANGFSVPAPKASGPRDPPSSQYPTWDATSMASRGGPASGEATYPLWGTDPMRETDPVRGMDPAGPEKPPGVVPAAAPPLAPENAWFVNPAFRTRSPDRAREPPPQPTQQTQRNVVPATAAAPAALDAYPERGLSGGAGPRAPTGNGAEAWPPHPGSQTARWEGAGNSAGNAAENAALRQPYPEATGPSAAGEREAWGQPAGGSGPVPPRQEYGETPGFGSPPGKAWPRSQACSPSTGSEWGGSSGQADPGVLTRRPGSPPGRWQGAESLGGHRAGSLPETQPMEPVRRSVEQETGAPGHGLAAQAPEVEALRGLVARLQERMAAAEAGAAAARAEASHARDTLSARVTVLEGRVRFLEAELASQRSSAAAAQPPPSSARSSPVRASAPQLRAAAEPAAAAAPARSRAALLGLSSRPGTAERPYPAAAPPGREAAASGARSDLDGAVSGLEALGLSRPLGGSGAHAEGGYVARGRPGPASEAGSQRSASVASMAVSTQSTYRNTNDLIQGIQSRYLEAQQLLNSFRSPRD